MSPVIEQYDIKITKDGTWFYQGTPITRHNLVRLFASVLKRDADGQYWLETPYERGTITVEDAPFIAVELQLENGNISFRTNVDDWVTLDADHPLSIINDPASGEPSPYITIRDGLTARLARPVFYELVTLAEKEPAQNGMMGITSRGIFFPIGAA